MSADECTEAREFDGADGVGVVELGAATVGVGRPFLRIDPKVCAARTFVAWANAIAPVVLIGKAATGPTDHAWFNFAESFDKFFAKAVDVRDGGLLIAHPEAVVDDGADVFDEVAVDFGRDDGAGFVKKDFDARIGGAGLAREEGLGSEEGRRGG